jgi:hypothetical protein
MQRKKPSVKKRITDSISEKGQSDSPPSKKQKLSPTRVSRDSASGTGKAESSNIQSDYDGELDEDYDDEYGEDDVDMKLYLKEEMFQSFKADQERIH